MAGLANKVIVLNNEGMGQGNPVLGATILAGFLRTLLEAPERPKAIFCYNGGVKLLVEGSPVLAHLQELASLGIPVQACKTCVDFFNLREHMRVGEISSMAQYVEYLETCEVVTL